MIGMLDTISEGYDKSMLTVFSLGRLLSSSGSDWHIELVSELVTIPLCLKYSKAWSIFGVIISKAPGWLESFGKKK